MTDSLILSRWNGQPDPDPCEAAIHVRFTSSEARFKFKATGLPIIACEKCGYRTDVPNEACPNDGLPLREGA